jgi:hypothetical protein
VPGLALAAALLLLSLLHWYWAFGGRRGLEAVLPTTEVGEPVLAPGRLACAGVAVALLIATALVLWRLCPYAAGPRWLKGGGVWLIAALFAARAIGDGRYVGFLKSVRGTRFAALDSRAYSPLSAAIALLALWLAASRP